MLSLDFPSSRFCGGKSEKEFEKLFSRTAVSHVHACLAEKRLLFMTTVLQILFRISKTHIDRMQKWLPDKYSFV